MIAANHAKSLRRALPCRRVFRKMSMIEQTKSGGQYEVAVALEKELETFRRELPGLLHNPANRGTFALVRGDLIAGLYPALAPRRRN